MEREVGGGIGIGTCEPMAVSFQCMSKFTTNKKINKLKKKKLWWWRRLLKVPWTARRSNLSILKDINPEYSLEGLTLKLKLQYCGHLIQRTHLLEKLRWLDGNINLRA